MRKSILFALIALAIILQGCAAKKNTSLSLYGTTWELEYISGPRIAFDGLFPEKKPQITFTESGKTANGNNSCNGFSTSFTVEENAIKIEEPKAMTMRYCEGGGEKVFLDMMKKIDAFGIDKDHKLNLMIDGVPMMRFKKINLE
jgi:heat shock protein HslJ